MNLKHNLPLIIGLAIPIVMVILVIGAIYIPGLFIQPQYNFLYAVGNYPTYVEQDNETFTEHRYSIEGTALTIDSRTIPEEAVRRYHRDAVAPRFYIYDIATDQNTEIDFAEATTVSLETEALSPDGFEVTHGRNDNSLAPYFFSSSRNYNQRFLKGNFVSKKLNVRTGTNSYGSGFNFVGWIID